MSDPEPDPPIPPPLPVQILASTRLFPANRSSAVLTTVPLSIVDATVANFSPAGAIWFFDNGRPETEIDTSAKREEEEEELELCESLTKVLESYRQWTGELHWSAYEQNSEDHTKRFRRMCLTWGKESDPGVEFVTASVERELVHVVPRATDRAKAGVKAWDHTDIKLDGLLPSTPLALRHLQTIPNAPVLAVQVTRFACGGLAIGVQMSHPVADATALATFVRDWGAVGRALRTNQPVPSLSPVFDPQRIDYAAAGEVDGPEADKKLIQISRGLPSLRYDWWAERTKCSWPGVYTEEDLATHDARFPNAAGDPIPWAQWDLEAPCSTYILHFTGLEVSRIWEAAKEPSSRISRHDALLAHLWKLINRARGLAEDHEAVHMNPSLGLRPRLDPPLSTAFLGSPIVMADVAMSGRDICTAPLPEIAKKINLVMQQFNPDTVPALLHDMAYSDCPQRIWRGCLGTRFTMVTSWVHLRLYDMDFGLGWGRPRYVEAVLLALDGLMQILELGLDAAGGDNGNKDDQSKVHWSDGGVDVSLALEKGAMERLLRDPLLRAYRE